jgi:biopolymer transport protein TolR
MSRLRNKKYRVRVPDVGLVPLIDMALTLLIIFIITTPIIQRNIKVDLPQGESREMGEQEDLVVSIDKNERIFFNTYPVVKNELVKTVYQACKGRRDIPIYIRADQKVPYGVVISIVDELKKAQIKYIAMAMKPNSS